MADHVLIPRDDSSSLFLDPTQPKVKPAWVTDSDGLIYLRCACGLILGSLRNHSIDVDGKVSPSVLHDPADTRWRSNPTIGECKWHVFAKLEGWHYEAMGKGENKIIPVSEPADDQC